VSSRFLGLALLGSAVVAALLTWPAAIQLDAALLGSSESDSLKHLWTLWWIRAEVLEAGRFPFATDYINYPTGMELYPIEPLNGLLAVLLGGVPLVAAANLVALANLTLTGFFGALMGRELANSPWGAVAAGLLLETSAFTLFTLHVGVGELQQVWWLPLGFYAWLRLRRSPSKKRAVWLALALVGAVVSCFYHGFFLALGVLVLSLITPWMGRDTPRLLGTYLLAAGLALALVVPISRGFATSFGEEPPPRVGLQTYVTVEGHGQPVTDPPSARLDPWQLVVPSDDRRETATREVLAYGGGRYLGWPAVLIAVGALVLRPRRSAPWIVVGAVGITFALGSYLVIDGETLLAGGSRLRLPFLYLNRALSYTVEALNFPVRFLALTATSLAALAAVLSRRALRGRSLAIPVAVLAALNAVDVQLHQLIPSPLSRYDFERYEGLEALRDDPGPVVELALMERADNETRREALAAQMSHGQKVHAVPLERIEFFARDGFTFVRALPLLEVLKPAFGGTRVELDPETHREDLALLADAGYRYLLVVGVGPDRQVSATLRQALTTLGGPAVLDDDRYVVHRIPEVEHTEAELEQWRLDHEVRVEALWGRTLAGPQLR